MRFIRKNGRIIPIMSKGENRDNVRSTGAKASFIGGAITGNGLTTLALGEIKRNRLQKIMGLSTMVAGLAVHTYGSMKQYSGHDHNSIKESAKSDLKSAGYGLSGVLAGMFATTQAKRLLYRNKGSMKNAANKVGDVLSGIHDKILVKRPKNIDLSGGAKAFKAKYREVHKVSGLLGYKK